MVHLEYMPPSLDRIRPLPSQKEVQKSPEPSPLRAASGEFRIDPAARAQRQSSIDGARHAFGREVDEDDAEELSERDVLDIDPADHESSVVIDQSLYNDRETNDNDRESLYRAAAEELRQAQEALARQPQGYPYRDASRSRAENAQKRMNEITSLWQVQNEAQEQVQNQAREQEEIRAFMSNSNAFLPHNNERVSVRSSIDAVQGALQRPELVTRQVPANDNDYDNLYREAAEELSEAQKALADLPPDHPDREGWELYGANAQKRMNQMASFFAEQNRLNDEVPQEGLAQQQVLQQRIGEMLLRDQQYAADILMKQQEIAQLRSRGGRSGVWGRLSSVFSNQEARRVNEQLRIQEEVLKRFERERNKGVAEIQQARAALEKVA